MRLSRIENQLHRKITNNSTVCSHCFSYYDWLFYNGGIRRVFCGKKMYVFADFIVIHSQSGELNLSNLSASLSQNGGKGVHNQ